MAQAEAVVAGDSARLAGQAKRVQDRIHEIPGAVAGKGAASAIGSMGTRGKAEDQDARARIAKAGDGA